jgi:glycolate oxidase
LDAGVIAEHDPEGAEAGGPVSPSSGVLLPQSVGMTQPLFEKSIGRSLDDFVQLSPEQRASVVGSAVPDLHWFFENDRSFEERDCPPRSRALARSLFDAISNDPGAEATRSPNPEAAAKSLSARIVTDGFLRSEADRDQNVYLGALFTRGLTQAVPDLIFQPATPAEAAVTFRWARENAVPVTLRGAASTAMGGSVPNDGGLTLDLSRLDAIEIDAAAGVCVVGAGARLRNIHQRLAARGLALECYPSNLGGTLVGWFVTGGIGLNAFGRGRALESVRAADLLLPAGEQVRLHDDGRMDVPAEGGRRRTLTGDESPAWFSERGMRALSLSDLAGSEGVLGLVLQVIVKVEPRRDLAGFLLSFASESDSLAAAEWVTRSSATSFGPPANLKLLSASHLEEVRSVWKDDDARAWKEHPGDLSSGADLPWSRIVGPRDVGAECWEDREHAGGYLFVDFLDLEAARAFAGALVDCPGSPIVLDRESARFAAERFRPQMTKRLGPGLLAAEILMPAREVKRYLPKARALAKNIGPELDTEVYYLANDEALVIAGYLTDHRSGAFSVDLTLAPALTDLAMNGFGGKPYVLGRWQSAWLARKVGGAEATRLRSIKQSLDPNAIVNRGVLLGLKLRGALGGLLSATFAPGIGMLRFVYGTPGLSSLARLARAVMSSGKGPAHGRGAPAVIGARPRPENGENGVPVQPPEDRALHCVNCGECNSVCPIFQDSKVRLPQMLTHLGEAMRGGETMPLVGSVLLDLCMRCGNCEEVCQAGIPHLPLYQVMQKASDEARPRDLERHTSIVAAVRGSNRYQRDFLHVRPGGYVKRSPAALPGLTRFLVLRAENDDGPAATCIHCGACVAVCPTHANREFEGLDPRWITTQQERCIGCGTCVEICPANLANGGQTLRVMEAPTRDWFVALEEFERGLDAAAAATSGDSGREGRT